MTVLPAHTASRIRNRSMGVLHLIAADESCEVSDILALITPWQPVPPKLPVARTYPPAPVDGQAEDAAPLSSATSTSEQREQLDGTGCTAQSDYGNSTGGGPDGAPSSKAADSVTGPPVDEVKTGKSAGEQSPAAPDANTQPEPTPRGTVPTKAQLVRRCLRDHPDWPASKIAEATGVKKGSVWGLAGGIRIATEAEYRAAQSTKTTEALKAAVPLPPRPGTPAPPKPIADALPMARPLKDRVREVHNARPDWTAAAIANHLGANMPSVSTLLAAVRKEAREQAPTQPVTAEGLEASIKSETAARRKRLGATS